MLEDPWRPLLRRLVEAGALPESVESEQVVPSLDVGLKFEESTEAFGSDNPVGEMDEPAVAEGEEHKLPQDMQHTSKGDEIGEHLNAYFRDVEESMDL
jgi:hypothetical protein